MAIMETSGPNMQVCQRRKDIIKTCADARAYTT